MKPRRFEESSISERLGYHNIPKAWAKLLPGQTFVFATMFLIFGLVITLRMLGFIGQPIQSNSSKWPWAFMGISFTLMGIFVLTGALAMQREMRRSESVARDIPELKDYAWDQTKFEVNGWGLVLQAAGYAIFLTVFLVPFNWFCFAPDGDWNSKIIAKIAIGFFDVVVLTLWFQTAKHLLHARKYGSSHIEFSRFPFRVSEPISVQFVPPKNISSINSGCFTLRCVEQWMEATGSGKNRSSHVIQEAMWTGIWHLDDARAFMPGEKIDLAFDPPAYTLPTSLSGPRTIYWELVVKLDVPGLDFEALYLVPVY